MSLSTKRPFTCSVFIAKPEFGHSFKFFQMQNLFLRLLHINIKDSRPLSLGGLFHLQAGLLDQYIEISPYLGVMLRMLKV